MSDVTPIKEATGKAAVNAILYNLPLDGFGQQKRLADYAGIWGSASARAVSPVLAEAIATVIEEYADDLEPPTTSDWLEQRAWFKGLLNELAAKARDIGGVS